ncbi:metabotropic GABA-B receptor subtype 3 [Carabus blaptoides fortunei]
MPTAKISGSRDKMCHIIICPTESHCNLIQSQSKRLLLIFLKDELKEFRLEEMIMRNKCDPGVGVDRFFHALYTQKSTRMVMLLGSACSEVTESLAKVVPYWNMVQVSFGSTSPALSDRSEFPLFYRTVAPDSSHNPARIAFVRRFGWDTVAALSQNEDAYSLALNDLVTELEQANITCTATITFAETDLRDQLKVLRDLDTRIIIGSFSHDVAPKIFCESKKDGRKIFNEIMSRVDFRIYFKRLVLKPLPKEGKIDLLINFNQTVSILKYGTTTCKMDPRQTGV